MVHKKRHKGKRWAIVYGSYKGVEMFAINELQRIVQLYMPYVLETLPESGQADSEQDHIILIGTCANNNLIRKLVESKQVNLSPESQGYTIKCCNAPWDDRKRLIVIAGADSHGVLYGVQDFNARLCIAEDLPGKLMHETEKYGLLDKLEDLTVHEYPLIKNRGIWTWGYVIYDYQHFIDNMARLKMNMLTIWNDCIPINCREVIDYAHSRGIKIILGFHWGWGMDYDLTNLEHRCQIKDSVINTYLQEYRNLGIDGIYFQTLTEHHNTEVDGNSFAKLVCTMVNDISLELFAMDSDLYIQFGVHAISISNKYEDLKSLDSRITIVWEDAGVIPYSYNPVTQKEDAGGQGSPCLVDTPEETVAYSKNLLTFRGDTEFAMIAKGWTCLNWDDEFEHHKTFILGQRDISFIRRRLSERQSRWDKVNILWLKNYHYALEFYREILNCNPSVVTASALIEDGLFEQSIQPSVSLFAEILWNPLRDSKEILQRAMNPYRRRC